MELIQNKSDCADNEIITIEECKEVLEKCNLSDQRVLDIRNNLVSIVDNIFNSYLENLR